MIFIFLYEKIDFNESGESLNKQQDGCSNGAGEFS